MKTIINGKLYDTDNAEEIGGFYLYDLEYGEYIYKLNTRQYFIHYIYSIGKENIYLINQNDILEWLEKVRINLSNEMFNTILNKIEYQEK